jgi:hypothetical protein
MSFINSYITIPIRNILLYIKSITHNKIKLLFSLKYTKIYKNTYLLIIIKTQKNTI